MLHRCPRTLGRSSSFASLLMIAIAIGTGVSLIPAKVAAQKPTREQKVREDKRKVEEDGFWIYNDLKKGFAEAKKSGKPLLVVLRCIPCEECVKLDDNLVDQDPVIRPLLDKFVCVRQVSTNGLDLSLFQYDTDQSFAVFFLNGDGDIYGRFGTRSHRTEWLGDVSLDGLAYALKAALKTHADYPVNKAQLAAQRGPKPEFPTPEQFPGLKEKYTAALNYEGNVVQSCIHCHQIGDARRDLWRGKSEPLPDEVLFPYPHPKSLGLTIDPKGGATVSEVASDSLAATAGLLAQDEIQRINGLPIHSLADFQWVLHNASSRGASLAVELNRGGAAKTITVRLPDGWRQSSDISWRASTWGLRRMATGGMLLETLSDEEREPLGLPASSMALRAKHVGEYGAHAAAKNAGLRKGDILVEFDGLTNLTSETAVLRHGLQNHKPGDQVPVAFLRDGKRQTVKIPMQK